MKAVGSGSSSSSSRSSIFRVPRYDDHERGQQASSFTHHHTEDFQHEGQRKPWKQKYCAIVAAVTLLVFVASDVQVLRRAMGATRPEMESAERTQNTQQLYIKKLDDAAEIAAMAATSAAEAATAAREAAVAAMEAANMRNQRLSTKNSSAGLDQTLWLAGKMPNEGRTAGGRWNPSEGALVDTGARSKYYGEIQRHHQEWLKRKAEADEQRRAQLHAEGMGSNDTASIAAEVSELEERIRRGRIGADLWGETYVPPIEPLRRQELIDKWSGKNRSTPEQEDGQTSFASERQEKVGDVVDVARSQGRILYVISSFDRGERIGPAFTRSKDKLDYILMMMDAMREACEAGFSPEVHLIAAWDPSDVAHLMVDRLFCERTGSYVPFSFKEYPHWVGNQLSIKHRIYMKPRLEDFDVFLQVEDDMLLTLNHILLYQEESELLENRPRNPRTKNFENRIVPGFIRVEPGSEDAEAIPGDNWIEWEIMLSRFFPIKITGAGTYLALRASIPAANGGNNQGLWMATREQLRTLNRPTRCRYLEYEEDSQAGNPETHSGSIQMFSSCGFDKVFPASHFEDFLVHHRANNKADKRGESIPGVAIRTLRAWVGQFLRDDGYMQSHADEKIKFKR